MLLLRLVKLLRVLGLLEVLGLLKLLRVLRLLRLLGVLRLGKVSLLLLRRLRLLRLLRLGEVGLLLLLREGCLASVADRLSRACWLVGLLGVRWCRQLLGLAWLLRVGESRSLRQRLLAAAVARVLRGPGLRGWLLRRVEVGLAARLAVALSWERSGERLAASEGLDERGGC